MPSPAVRPPRASAWTSSESLERLPGADVVWLCAPNNPTGAPEPLDTIVRILEAAAAAGPEGTRRRRG